MLSIGGRITLINFVLSTVPLYALSIYKIPTKVLKQIDKCKCQFLWNGAGINRKTCALVNWKAIYMAIDFGGLGILELNQMNITLLLK